MVGGLCVHLTNDANESRQAIALIQQRESVTLGEQYGQRLAVVVESVDRADAEATIEWLQQLPGVVHVDIAFVHLDEVDDTNIALKE